MAIKYPFCYCCDKTIIIEGGISKTSTGDNVTASEDYRSIDIHLSDGHRVIAFATPVCKECLELLLKENKKGSNTLRVKEKLINNCKKEKNWGFGDNFFNKPLSVVGVADLTKDLVESGIIKCL